MEDFEPQEIFIIEDLETLRALADPMRSQIYEILLQAPASVRSVAERLGLASGRLYYHFNAMEKLGAIRVVETRMVANMMEKMYRAVAYNMQIAPDLLNFNTDQGKQAVTNLLTASLDATREDLLRSLQARLFELDRGAKHKQRNVMVNRVTATIPDALAETFNERLHALIKEFQEADRQGMKEEGYHPYALMVAFYPSFYFSEESQEEPQEDPTE
jgi:DNA-binding transcriptional ArsR family regulator